jgi:hypothetical protein
MIHIATVHWQTDRWISVQQAYFRRHIQSPYRIYAWLNDVPGTASNGFYYTCSEPVNSHAVKLNLLAEIVGRSTDREDDMLIFVDGDAFPIADVEPLLNEKLATHKLVAVQRLENNGDIQPHPCFCATTVGLWREIKGDWKEGYLWKNKGGEMVTDVGGNLMYRLREHRIEWYPLLRSNKRNLHPVLFGVYADLIYHHAAGFRPAVTRHDRSGKKRQLLKKISYAVPGPLRPQFNRIFFERYVAKNSALSERVFDRIGHDPLFYKEFI